MKDADRRQMARALAEAGEVDPRHVGWKFATSDEVETAYWELQDRELDRLPVERYPDISLFAAGLLQRLGLADPDARGAVGAMLAMVYVAGWNDGRLGKELP